MASNPEEGRRQAMLEKQRKDMMDDIARQKEALQKETERHKQSASDRFTVRSEGIDEKLKKSTIGLVTLDDFRKTRNELEEASRREAALTGVGTAEGKKKEEGKKEKERGKRERERERKKRGEKGRLSFAVEGEEEEEGGEKVGVKRKDKDEEEADTSFLPDRAREARERLEREQLRQEWLKRQEKMKGEGVEVTYSYWDGTGHRKSVECVKGNTIGEFLNKCKAQFPELRGTSVDNLMYIKEDLIIPHHYTFYDFIINKARGKSGPLFSFDVHDDVRMLHDATKERDESHAGKVVERSWYQRSKHIFPASRWEVYDPDKDYGAYRIG